MSAESTGQRASYQIGIRVLDARTREPLQRFMIGASYHVKSETGQDRHVRIRRIVRDPEGSYVLEDLPRTAVFIAVRAPGLGPEGYGHAVRFVIPDQALPAELEFLLERSVSFRGEVVDRAGLPVAGATVTVEYQDRLKDRVSQSVLEQARSEGFVIASIEAPEEYGPRPFTGPGTDERASGGHFHIRGIDAGRPLRLIVSHDELGVTTSEIMTLEPGTDVEGLRLQYR